jgi:hypothetical protein
MAKRKFFRNIRIIFMFFILFLVGGDALLTRWRTTDWDAPLLVAIYPVNGDKSIVAAEYIKQLSKSDFADVSTFLEEEAKEYKLELTHPVELTFREQIAESPPMPPADRNVFGVMWWSLKLRYWVWQVKRQSKPTADVQLFILYFDPKQHDRLAHSLGIQKGLIGVVNAFAHQSYTAQNNIIITHEFLHTVGATDKYDLNTGMPIFPQGFVEPDKDPLYPQEFAEIMAGSIPITKVKHKMPESLVDTIVGVETALDIGWIDL